MSFVVSGSYLSQHSWLLYNHIFCLAIEALQSLNNGKEKERVYQEERGSDWVGSKNLKKQLNLI